MKKFLGLDVVIAELLVDFWENLAKELWEDRHTAADNSNNKLGVSKKLKVKLAIDKFNMCRHIKRVDCGRRNTYAQLPWESIVYVESLDP